jgi:hypothetical protein
MTISEILESSRRGKLPYNALFIAFHDGYLGNYLTAFPILKKMGLRVDFFVSTGFMDSECFFWVDVLDAALKYTACNSLKLPNGLGEVLIPLQNEAQRLRAAYHLRKRLKSLPVQDFNPEITRILTKLGWEKPQDVPRLGDHTLCLEWKQVKEMSDAGMSFGSHTHNHVICAPQEEAVIREEMFRSKQLIERETGRPCVNFCYPNGNFPENGNEFTDSLAHETGYRSVLYMMSAANLVHARTFRLTGGAMGDDTQINQLARGVSRPRFMLRRLRRDKIWPWRKNSL